MRASIRMWLIAVCVVVIGTRLTPFHAGAADSQPAVCARELPFRIGGDISSLLEADKQGTPPFMVREGNEIAPGMLWDDGKLTEAIDTFGK